MTPTLPKVSTNDSAGPATISRDVAPSPVPASPANERVDAFIRTTPVSGPSLAPSPLVRQVDHFFAETNRDNHDAERLFAFLRDVLQLPVTWDFIKVEGYATGAVFAGNCDLEVLRLTSPNLTTPAPGTARWFGIGLEPDDEQFTAEETGRRDTPTFDLQVSGAVDKFFLKLSARDRHFVFGSFYQDRIALAARRERTVCEMHACQGGPLGVVAVSELLIGAKDYQPAHREWSKVLGAENSGVGCWALGQGPLLRLVQNPRDAFLAVTLRVRNLSAARRFLHQRGLLEPTRSGAVRIQVPGAVGLEVRVVE